MNTLGLKLEELDEIAKTINGVRIPLTDKETLAHAIVDKFEITDRYRFRDIAMYGVRQHGY